MRVRSAVVSVSNGRCCAFPFVNAPRVAVSLSLLMSAYRTILPPDTAIPQSTDSPATPFAPSLSAGGVATGRRYSFGCKPLPRSPPFSYRVPSVWGIATNSLRLFLPPPCNRGSGNKTILFVYGFRFVSATPCGNSILFFGGGDGGRRKNAKIRWLVEDFLKF